MIDLYSVKPVDSEALNATAEATHGRVLTVEDHLARGAASVRQSCPRLAENEEHPRVVKLGVREMPGSGKPAELLAAAGIDAEHIAEAARELVRASAVTA